MFCRRVKSPNIRIHLRRFNFGVDQWIDCQTPKSVEKEWKGDKLRRSLPRPETESGAKNHYVLSMFPYPSGKLHMGHVRVYSISDTFAHLARMKGLKVIHPMGWDAFGLPAENAAMEKGVDPAEWTESNIEAMKRQLQRLGCTFDWEREISTCDPNYYKWTQWIFLELLRNGLAYRKEALVNWDPVDKTVLADEQVDKNGKSWRSGALVEKRRLKQWFLRTTNLCKELYDGLDDPDLEDWRYITNIQRGWIGECDGTKICFATDATGDNLEVWTDKPELLLLSDNVDFIGISEEHPLASKSGVTAVNPLNGDEIPVKVTNEPDSFPEGCDSYLSFKTTQSHSTISREEALRICREKNVGGYLSNSKLKDWLISRQRYWGTPIPIIHCANCGPIPVPESELPVKLPESQSFSSSPDRGVESPLSQAEAWLNVPCPKCREMAKRETDTMDTFVDSSWYFLRFLDPNNADKLVEPGLSAAGMPVQLYIGGEEHATLHMYYARFITRFLETLGVSPVKEPFKKLLVQGMVKGRTFKEKETGRYLKADEVDSTDPKSPKVMSSGKIATVEWEKMSKSKHNGVDPDILLDKYGCDTTRLMMLSVVSPKTDRNWSEDEYPKIRNLLSRYFKLVEMAVTLENESLADLPEKYWTKSTNQLREGRNKMVKFCNHGYNICNPAPVIVRLQSYLGDLWNAPPQVKQRSADWERGLADAIILLAPMAPHLGSELWRGFSSRKSPTSDQYEWKRGVFAQRLPVLDPGYNLNVVVRRNDRDLVEIPVAKWKFDTLTEDDAFDLACHENVVQRDVLPHDFDKRFFMFKEYEAYLDFKVQGVDSQIDPEERKRLKAEEKRLKQERKEKRMQKRRLAEERKAAKSAKS